MHLPAALWGYKLLSMPLIIYPHIVAPAIYIYHAPKIYMPCTGHVLWRPPSLEQDLSDGFGGLGCLWSRFADWGRGHLSNHSWKQRRLVLLGFLVVWSLKISFYIGIVFHKRWYIRIYPWLLHLWENSPRLNFKFIPTLAAHRFPVQTLTVPTEELQEVLEKRTTTLKGLGFATCVYVVKVLTGKICTFICAINMFYTFFFFLCNYEHAISLQDPVCVHQGKEAQPSNAPSIYSINGRFKKT